MKRSILEAAVLLVVFCGVIQTALGQSCTNIESVDFKNRSIWTMKTKDRPGQLELRFQNGIYQDKVNLKGRTIIDYTWTIVRDSIVRPQRDTTFRFIEVFGAHSASSSERYLFGFRCLRHEIRLVFQQVDEGMKVVALSSRQIHLNFAVWKDTDAHCCPSGERDVWFGWDSSKNAFVRQGNRIVSQ